MTTFRLERQSPGKTLTKFFVYDADESIVGTINVSNEAAGDLEKHWRGAPPQASLKRAANGSAKQISAMVAASRKPTRAAILRGC